MSRVVFVGIETSIAGWWLKSYNFIKVKNNAEHITINFDELQICSINQLPNNMSA